MYKRELIGMIAFFLYKLTVFVCFMRPYFLPIMEINPFPAEISIYICSPSKIDFAHNLLYYLWVNWKTHDKSMDFSWTFSLMTA